MTNYLTLPAPEAERTRLSGLREAVVAMAAALGTLGVAVVIRHAEHLSVSLVILGVALALSVGRISRRPDHAHGRSRWLALAVVPLVAVGANEIGARMLEHPDFGDALFVTAVSGTIWVRRFGPRVSRIATLATLPLITMLVVPGAAVSLAGSSSGQQRWWSALIAMTAVVLVRALGLAAEKTGWLTRPTAPPALDTEATTGPSQPGNGKAATGTRRIAASTKMALQMGVALTAAFAVGRSVFPSHWTWVVLTTFIVSSGNRGREDVVHKGALRILGAGAGTLVSTVVASAFSTGNNWSIVAIFAVLGLATWLRPRSYAYWAGGMTSALALLYGYFGEAGTSLLADRLQAIVVGAVLAVAAAWLLLPVRTTDVLRRDLARALAALADWLNALGADHAGLAGHHVRFAHAVRALDQPAHALRVVPRRLRRRPDYLPAVPALRRAVEALPRVAEWAQQGGRAGPEATGREMLAPIRAELTRLRRAIGARSEPEEGAWARLVDAIAALGEPATQLGEPATPTATSAAPTATSATGATSPS